MSLHSSCGMEEMEVSCVTLKVVGSSALKLVKLYEWQRQQLTAAVLSWKTAVNVTCSQGGSGSKGTSWKGRSLSDLSSLFPTPCLHHFTLFAYQITSPEFLAAHWSMQASCHVGYHCLATYPVAVHSDPGEPWEPCSRGSGCSKVSSRAAWASSAIV